MNAASLLQMGEIVVQVIVSCYWQRRVPSISCCDSIHSSGPWLRPFKQGMKIIPIGPVAATYTPSWPAPPGKCATVSTDYLSVADDIEDIATDAPRVVNECNSGSSTASRWWYRADSRSPGRIQRRELSKLPVNAF